MDKMYVLGKRDDLKKLGLGVGNDLTTLQRKELQTSTRAEGEGKRGFYRNASMRLPLPETRLPAVKISHGGSRQFSSTSTSHRHQ
ncbi:hypothetical protein ElyMa_004881600 [Elysia marginata]|uniref:SAM domain-containing protein n=1 Tax=Elysia marginata TaxID=1093978 RepID=A0AAV4ITN3_9GAST|nr:hypothetical protein ElyMa_004881600 [Elysia marginata]